MSNKNRRFVAIIDDELDIVELFYDALTGINGIALFKFTNPMLAIEHIKLNKNAYVLIISDLRMPGLNGIDLIKSVKTLNQNIRTVLMTAFELDDNLFEEYTKNEIINGFIQKPIKLNTLLEEANKQIDAFNLGLTRRKRTSRLELL